MGLPGSAAVFKVHGPRTKSTGPAGPGGPPRGARARGPSAAAAGARPRCPRPSRSSRLRAGLSTLNALAEETIPRTLPFG
jgi:hypothetical protein